jgi:uncharacterized protein (DUF433 family)
MTTTHVRAPKKPRRKAGHRAAKAVVHSDPGILGGMPVFVGTRVPFKNLIDYLSAGDPLEEFLDDFPGVSREQAVASLTLAQRLVEEHANPPR